LIIKDEQEDFSDEESFIDIDNQNHLQSSLVEQMKLKNEASINLSQNSSSPTKNSNIYADFNKAHPILIGSKLVSLNEEETCVNENYSIEDTNICDNSEKSKLEKEENLGKIDINTDINDIKDKIKEKVRKLDLTIQRLGNKIDRKGEENIDYNSAKHGEALHFSKPSEENNNYEDSCSQESIYQTPMKIEDDYKNLILKIPTNLLDDNIGEVALYVKLESSFKKISNEEKLKFTEILKSIFENHTMIKSSSFNCFLQLFEFLLNLLTHVC